jgi:hypothetical protein
MSRWGSNGGLLFISFLMAVGIVWIKAQDRMDRRTLTGIPVSVENLPGNMVLPDSWTPPAANVLVRGPRRVLELISAAQCGFFIRFSPQTMPEKNSPQNVILTESMFRTSLMDDDDQKRIAVDETSIHPRQVSLYFLPWNVDQQRPDYDDINSTDSLTIPIYLLQKKIHINAPVVGNLPGGLKLKDVVVDPPDLVITGPREAVDRIRSVSTATMDLSYISSQPPPQYMELPDMEEQFAVWPVEKTIRGVTVTLMLSK